MRNTYQNIPNRVIEIDTKFAKIISSVANNQYNPGYLYDIADKIYSGNKQLQNQVTKTSKKNDYTDGNDYYKNNFKNIIRSSIDVPRKIDNKDFQNLQIQTSKKNDYTDGDSYTGSQNNYISETTITKPFDDFSLTSAILDSQQRYDQEKSIYTGKSNSQNYVRYIDTKVLGQISQLALQRYNKINATGNNSIYNGDPNHSPYRPIPVPSSITQLLTMTQAISSGGLRSLAGLGQYYFGGRMRIGRSVARTKNGGFQLTSFIAYNTFRGIFLNMTPTPMSFTLGFDIPLIGPLAINVVGGFGAGGFKSSYASDENRLLFEDSNDLHTLSRPKQAIPGKKSNLLTLQTDVLGSNSTVGINDFYKTVSQIRQNGMSSAKVGGFQKRQAAFSNNLLAGILNKFLKPKQRLHGESQINEYYKTVNYDRRYKKIVTIDGQLVDFYRQVNISSPSVILIKIFSEKNYLSIGNTLVIPATIKSISDNNSTQWQDTWNNTGRFQPIKAYMGVTRTVDVTFSVFAYTLFNDVNIQDRRKSLTRRQLNLNTKGMYNKNRDDLVIDTDTKYSALQSVIQNANNKYHQTMGWLKQLTYPIVDKSGVKRYNVLTKLTIGEYITDEEVIVNSVNITPSQQFYWTYKFPMLVDVSMSFTVFRKTFADGSISGKLYNVDRITTQYTIPGMPSYKQKKIEQTSWNPTVSEDELNKNSPQNINLIK